MNHDSSPASALDMRVRISLVRRMDVKSVPVQLSGNSSLSVGTIEDCILMSESSLVRVLDPEVET